jgi:hypothetical protein
MIFTIIVKENGKMKIGALVKYSIARLIELELLSESDIKSLNDEIYSKKVFNVNYSVLKEFKYDLSVSEQRNVNGYPRYYASLYTINRRKYLLCNDWYDDNNRKYFITWLNRFE